MTLKDIVFQRLQNQQLTASRFTEPSALVRWMGAVQAQDYGMCKWAVGIRVAGSTDESIEREIDNGKIIRTHVLRPTWHLVASDDVRWMLELTASHINRRSATTYRNLELDEKLFKKTNRIIQKALSAGEHLTREEIMGAINKKGIVTNDLRGAHLMSRAELDMLVCNGARKGKQFTYALLDDRVPATKKVEKEDALARLANRYFNSHGPATLRDFSWWSGLPAMESRTAMELIKQQLRNEKIEGETYWFSENNPEGKVSNDTIHFLPAYDEWIISYNDRSASLPAAYMNDAILGNGIFKPVIVWEGRVVGIWKRTMKNRKLVIEVRFLHSERKIRKKELSAAAKKAADFLGMQLEIRTA